MKLKDLIPEMQDIIYRCGWCGLPVDKDGNFLPDVNNYKEADAYLKKHSGVKVELVNGECCPEGDGSTSDWDDHNE